jgi:mono/diheme cytochrome c family protein
MRTQIRKGVGAMPAFTEQMLGDAEVDAIVDYLNALQETPGPL